jgi:hypothetical protein
MNNLIFLKYLGCPPGKSMSVPRDEAKVILTLSRPPRGEERSIGLSITGVSLKKVLGCKDEDKKVVFA